MKNNWLYEIRIREVVKTINLRINEHFLGSEVEPMVCADFVNLTLAVEPLYVQQVIAYKYHLDMMYDQGKIVEIGFNQHAWTI
jgi:hypothetical protein